MTPFFWQSKHGNFGDDLNLWLWDFLLPGLREVRDDVLLVGVGTVLNAELLAPYRRKLVIGSGLGYGVPPAMDDANEWDVRCVRGPLTAKRLGLDPRLAVVDPAVMVAEMPEFQDIEKRDRTVFVPHWQSTVGGLWPELCRLLGIGYVDPCGEARSVIRQIAAARLVLAESMHAAILADAFRVPWIAVTTSATINGFKWRDWAASLDLTYAPQRVPLSSRAEAIAKGGSFLGVDFAGTKAPGAAAQARGPLDDVPVMEEAPRADPGTGLRRLGKQVLGGPAALALWRAARAVPQLSSDSVLARRKDALRAVLGGVRRDYF